MFITTQISYLYLRLNEGVTHEYQVHWGLNYGGSWFVAGPESIRGHSGQNSTRTRFCGFISWNLDVLAFCPLKKCLGITISWLICLRFSTSWCFSLRVLMSRFFGLGISMSGFFGYGIPMSWYMCFHSLAFVIIVKSKKKKKCRLCWWKIFQLWKFMQHLSAQCMHKQIRIMIRILYSLVTFV